jgi:hypothetical protein
MGLFAGGPIGNGGDAWQSVLTLSGIGGDIMAPKNIGEEYRRNTPVMYYACDANFLDYFGSNGMAAVDGAFAIMNIPAGTTPPSVCPEDEEFEVVQRNYDIVPSSLNQLQYSPYINDTLYTFTIFYWPNCRVPAGQTYTFTTLPVPVDPFAPVDTAVASDSLADGGFFTGLSRDDVGGLRYLMTTNNINTEDAVPGSLLLITNTLLNQHITTLPMSSLLAQSQTDSPAQLQAAFPGLVIASATPYTTTVAVTNITAYYTNQPYFAGPGTNGTTVTNFGYPPQFLVTGDLGLLLQRSATNDPATLQALYPGLLVSTVTNFGVQTFTNSILSVTNDATNYLTLSLTTSDLGLLMRQATNDPATLQALYPQLVFSTVTNSPTVVITTNITAYYTNQPGLDVTNLGDEQITVPPPSAANGGTLDFGLFSLQALTNSTVGNNPALAIVQLQALYPGLVIVSATGYPTNVVTTNFVTSLVVPNGEPVGSPAIQVTSIGSIVTNRVIRYSYIFGNVMIDSNSSGAFYPFVSYKASAGLYSTNQYVTIQTTIIATPNGEPVGSPPATNITTTTVRQYGISGDFFIVPISWCGFTILTNAALDEQPILEWTPSYSNVVSAAFANGSTFSATTVSLTYYYTNVQYVIEPGICEPVVQFATNYTTNVVVTYQNTLLNIATNNISATSLETVLTTNIFTTNGAPWGTLYTNGPGMPPGATNITVAVTNGDFFFIPTNWCGYQIVATQLTSVVFTTNTTLTAGPSPIFAAPGGVPSGVSVSYTQSVVTSFTNHTLLIHEGVCEPALTTNITYFTTNVLIYQNTLLNIITNSYFSNSLVAIGTTYIGPPTNGAPVGTVTNYTNPNLTNSLVNVPAGDFFILPTNWCGFKTNGVLLTSAVTTTNIVGITVGGVGGGGGTPFTFSTTTITTVTNHTLAIQPGVCEPLLFFYTNVVSTDVTNYQYVFGNLVTYTNAATGPATILTTNISVVAWSNAVTLTNVVSAQTNSPAISLGEFFILPPTWCGYVILTNQLIQTNVVYTTNTFEFVTTNTFGITGGNQQFSTTGGGVVVPLANSNVVYSQTIISSATNHTYLVQPQTCSTAADPARLREGIEKIQFLRANFDSLLGQFFQPITNDYTMVIVTNSQTVTEFFQRVVTTPDILLSAADTTGTLPFFTTFERGINFDEANVLPGLAGPGTINPTTTFTYNKVGDIYLNGPMSSYGITTNSFLPYLNELTQTPMLSWASFDATTNAPVVYPNGTSIQNLENEILVQVTPPPPTLPDGANGVQYSPTTPYGFVYTNSAGAVAVYTNTFTASGGSFSPPFTWSVVSGLQGQGLPSGLSLSPAGVLSGTPAGNTPGQFDFTVQLTDSLGRSVNWNYTITIDY